MVVGCMRVAALLLVLGCTPLASSGLSLSDSVDSPHVAFSRTRVHARTVRGRVALGRHQVAQLLKLFHACGWNFVCKPRGHVCCEKTIVRRHDTREHNP